MSSSEIRFAYFPRNDGNLSFNKKKKKGKVNRKLNKPSKNSKVATSNTEWINKNLKINYRREEKIDEGTKEE